MNKMKLTVLSIFLLMPAYVMASADVKIEISAEKVMIVEKDGKKVEKLVAADEVFPGDILVYTLEYKNVGDEAATGANMIDPIPEATTYVIGSAFGPGSDVTFSIDNGKSFNPPSLLTYTVESGGETVTRKASPEQYTDIRWTVKSIPAGKSGVAGFRVRVK